MPDHLAWLFSLEQIGIKLGLEQIRALVGHLDHPDAAFPSIVIAGTNGKGSVTAMIERGLRAAGYRTGRYISPHLVRLEERFAVDGAPIDGVQLDRLAGRVREAASRLPSPPSFFEATTAMALECFRDSKVDIAVLEVGLGGRLDATNVVHPIGIAITSIDFDHEQYLGRTIAAIAAEKAGVIKPGAVAVLGRNSTEVQRIVQDAASAAGAPFVFAPDDVLSATTMVEGRTRVRLRTQRHDYGEVVLGLRGRHQVDNAIVAVRLLEELSARQAVKLTGAAIHTAITEAEWPARLELLPWGRGSILLDGAHNPAGARALASYVAETYGRRLPFVVGAMRDKDVAALLGAMAPAASHFVCASASTPRAATPVELAAAARAAAPGVDVRAMPSPASAIALARDFGDPIVAAGSLYLAGEIRQLVT